MLRSLFCPNGPRVCLVHQRSYAIMDRAKTRAGISLDTPPLKPPKKSSALRQENSSQKVITYEKPKDRSLGLQHKRTFDRFPSGQPNQGNQGQSAKQSYKNQQHLSSKSAQQDHRHHSYRNNDYGNDRPATERYHHPLRRQKEANYDNPWSPTPLKVISRSTAAPATESLQTTGTGDLKKPMMPTTSDAGVENTTKRQPSSLHQRLMRMNQQKAAGMAERLIKPIKEFTQPENPHFIKVAVIGAPNAGKSTLVNKIIGEEVSIVSSKSHTTRERILAILSEKNYQVVFLDTPGVLSPKSKENMNRSITTSSWRSLDEADHVLIMIDSKYANTKESQQVQEFMMERLSALNIPATLLFNKMDIIGKDDMESLNKMDIIGKDDMESLNKVSEAFKSVYPNLRNQLYISALEEDGIKDVKDILFESAKPKSWIYPPEQTVEISDLKRVEELIRVEFFKRLHRYIPYMLKQENMVWAELANGTLRIEQNVYVERDSQHKIVVGANGMIINRVVEDARLEISKAFKRPIQLFIQVKTRKK